MMPRRTSIVLHHLLLACLFAIIASSASAHDARPLSLTIRLQGNNLYQAELAIPPSVERFNQPRVIWPEVCEVTSESSVSGVTDGRWRGIVSCAGGLEGQAIGIVYPYYNPSLSTVIQLLEQDSTPRTTVLSPAETSWTVPVAPSFGAVAWDYLTLGVEHILGGIDHLFFVAGLLFLARTGRRVLIVITGFTVAHSITLSLSALGMVSVPVPPTEAAIALSILFLASELARGNERSLAYRYPAAVSLVFGLLHGLGFAAALSDIGLPAGQVTTALLFFNLGVEAGQIAFVLPMLALFYLAARLFRATQPRLPAHAQTAAGYALGLPSAVWFIDRAMSL